MTINPPIIISKYTIIVPNIISLIFSFAYTIYNNRARPCDVPQHYSFNNTTIFIYPKEGKGKGVNKYLIYIIAKKPFPFFNRINFL